MKGGENGQDKQEPNEKSRSPRKEPGSLQPLLISVSNKWQGKNRQVLAARKSQGADCTGRPEGRSSDVVNCRIWVNFRGATSVRQ